MNRSPYFASNGVNLDTLVISIPIPRIIIFFSAACLCGRGCINARLGTRRDRPSTDTPQVDRHQVCRMRAFGWRARREQSITRLTVQREAEEEGGAKQPDGERH